MARVESLHIGKPAWRRYGERDFFTAAHREPVAEAWLATLGFENDAQGDTAVHGGPDKAVCFYPGEHYRHWEQVLGLELPQAAFGENVTLSGLRETEVCIGDLLVIGAAAIQISQPRQPCAKLEARHGRPGLRELVYASGFTGFYGRVLEPGRVRAGDPVVVCRRDPAEVTVAFATDVMHRRPTEGGVVERLLSVEALSHAWRESLARRLGGKA